MHKALIRRSVITGAIVISSCTLTTIAYADISNGQWTGMGTIGGRNYENRASLETRLDEAGGARGTAWIRTVNGAVVPAGILGAQASLWKSGVLCTDTVWRTNTGDTSLWTTSTPLFGDCGAGYYFGDGQVSVYKPSTGQTVKGYPVESGTLYQN